MGLATSLLSVSVSDWWSIWRSQFIRRNPPRNGNPEPPWMTNFRNSGESWSKTSKVSLRCPSAAGQVGSARCSVQARTKGILLLPVPTLSPAPPPVHRWPPKRSTWSCPTSPRTDRAWISLSGRSVSVALTMAVDCCTGHRTVYCTVHCMVHYCTLHCAVYCNFHCARHYCAWPGI